MRAPHRAIGVKRTYLQEADPHDVSAAVRRVLESGGALVQEHVSTHVRFQSLPPQRPAWRRQGYVGIYQPYGDPDVEVRLLLRANWPWRLLWGAAAFNLVLFVVLLAMQPTGTTWYLAAFLMGLLLLVTGILHLNTMHAVRAEERGWMRAFEEELSRALPSAGLVTSDLHVEQEAMEEVEGEIARRRMDERRKHEPKPEKGSRFALRPKKDEPAAEAAPARDEAAPAEKRAKISMPKFARKAKEAPAPEETPEEKLARLRAKKAELERQNERP